MAKTELVKFRVDHEMLGRIKAQAATEGEPVATIVRQAVRHYLAATAT